MCQLRWLLGPGRCCPLWPLLLDHDRHTLPFPSDSYNASSWLLNHYYAGYSPIYGAVVFHDGVVLALSGQLGATASLTLDGALTGYQDNTNLSGESCHGCDRKWDEMIQPRCVSSIASRAHRLAFFSCCARLASHLSLLSAPAFTL